MRLKIEVVKDENDGDNNTVSIEQHHRRGDTFTVHRADTVMVGEGKTITLSPGMRLVINSQMAEEKLVYDRDQGASVFASQQAQGREGADRPNPAEIVKHKERELAEAKDAAQRQKEMDERQAEAANTALRTPPQGGKPVGPLTPPQRPQNGPGATTTNPAPKTPNPVPGQTPPNPATAQASGSSTEKK